MSVPPYEQAAMYDKGTTHITKCRGNRPIPEIFRVPLCFRDTFHTSCFNATIEKPGEKWAKATKTSRNHLIWRFLGCGHIDVRVGDTIFPVVGLARAAPGHTVGCWNGEGEWEKGR